MDFDPHDQDIVNLLTKLKHAERQYPEHMFVARRHMFLKQMADVEMGIGADTALRNAAENANSSVSSSATSATSATSTLLEAALVVAIIVETGAVAYFYRDKIADFFQTNTSELRVQDVNPPPVVTTSTEIFGVTPSSSPVITATLPSATLFVSASPTDAIISPSSTSIPEVAEDENNAIVTGSTQPGTGSAQTGSTPVSNSTPVPNENNGNNGNNGNHYGQTPKPERTKENNGNNNPAPQENNNPPKDSNPAPQESNDKPTKEPKPTKTK